MFDATLDGTELESVITLRGELDMATVPALRTAVLGELDSDVRRIVLDLDTLAFIDSAGFQGIVGLHERARRTGVRLVLRHPSTTASRVLSITGLDEVLHVEVG
ncbi:MAG: STAS domain-containing protein [Actinomycetota bacterium]|nr:STAS domain-containing protein [Actinomycetota bacterium]